MPSLRDQSSVAVKMRFVNMLNWANYHRIARRKPAAC
jgi:hypothetical protein